MNYKGYIIEHTKYGYYLVTGETETWTEDTVQEAKCTIDSIEKEQEDQDK